MLAELFAWLTTPCPAAARRLGCLRVDRNRSTVSPTRRTLAPASRKIESRHRRSRIEGVAPPPRGRARLRAPLMFLSKSSRMRSTLWNSSVTAEGRAKSPQVSRMSGRASDVSGAAAALAALPRNAVTAPLLVAPPSLMPDTDLVVPAKLLSQLPDIPEIVLKKRPRPKPRGSFAHQLPPIISIGSEAWTRWFA